VLLAARANLHENRAFSAAIQGNLGYSAGCRLVARTARLVAFAELAEVGYLAINLLLGGAVKLATRVDRAAFVVVLVHKLTGAAFRSVLLATDLLAVGGKGGSDEGGRLHGWAHGGSVGGGESRNLSGGGGWGSCKAESLSSDLLAAVSSVFLRSLGTGHVDTGVVFAGTLGAQTRTDSTANLAGTGEFGHVVSVVEGKSHLVCRSVVIHRRRTLEGRCARIHGVHETDAIGGHTVALGKSDAA